MSADNSGNPIQQQQAVFEDFWLRFSEQVKNGEGQVDFPSQVEMKPTYTTTVVRLPPELTERCLHLVKEIRAAYPDHYYYPKSDMHFTLLNLDKLITANNGEIDPDSVTRNLKQALANLPPLEINVTGLGLFPTTIFAKLYDVSGVLEEYRTAIKSAVVDTLAIAETDTKALVEGIAFVNLVRFRHTPEPELVNLVKGMRDTGLGTFRAGNVELVETNKLLSLSETIVRGTITLEK